MLRRLNNQKCRVAWRRYPVSLIASRNGCTASMPCSTAATTTTSASSASSSSALRNNESRRFKSTAPAIQDLYTPSFTSPPRLCPTTTTTPPKTKEVHLVTTNNNNKKSATAVTTRQQPDSMTYTGNATIPFTSTLRIIRPQDDIPRGIWPAFRMMDEDGSFRDPRFDGLKEASVPVQETHSSVAVVPPESGASSSSSSFSFAGSEFCAHLKLAYPHCADELERSQLLKVMEDAKSSFTGRVDMQEKLPLFMRAHRQMVRLREMDKILLHVQRQGRISFYMACTGEEAIHMGSASALHLKDQVFAQYREQGVLMWRGFSLEQFTNQCFSNDLDLGKGRQMPVHYGSRALNYHTVSSPLGTQIPQAAGAAYRLKLAKQDAIVMCFFGDGCASTTDFHSGLNFAATLKAPVVFFCRNNGYAISTPVTDQYCGDGIVSRAPGYGMAAIRVDGNDIFAVHAAVREARKYASEHSAPVLIEAMTYRLRDHSTSDDSTRYRDASEVEKFSNNHDPLDRLETFMIRHGWLTYAEADRMRENERSAVLQAMEHAEQRPPPPVRELFSDVYADLPPHLQEQEKQLHEHIAKYPDKYA